MAKRFSFLLSYLDQITLGVTLAILLLFTYAFFVHLPYAGFLYSSAGQIVEQYVENKSGDEFQLGDELAQVGTTPWPEFFSNGRQTLFEGVQPGDIILLVIHRDEQVITISWFFPGPTLKEVVQRLNSQWWLSYIFWLAGTATILLIRPRDTRWKLLVAFNYLTAIWLIAGASAQQHIWNSLFVLKSAVWLSLPVYLHLHWYFPQPLGYLPPAIPWSVYLIAIVLAILEWFQAIPKGVYQFAFLLAGAGSLLLLFIRLFWREQRRDLGFLLAALLLTFVPPLVILAAQAVNVVLPPFIQGGSVLALPAIPGAYVYTLYRHQLGPLAAKVGRLLRLYLLSVALGSLIIVAFATASSWLNLSGSQLFISISAIALTAVIAVLGFAPFLSFTTLAGAYHSGYQTTSWLELRANHSLAPFLFFVFLGAVVASLAAFAELQFNFAGATLVTTILVAFLVGFVAIVGYRPFQRWVEHRLLGIPLPPTSLLESYAARITRSLDKASLVHLLTEEVLPSLFIRQSVLLSFEGATSDDQTAVMTLYAVGIESGDIPQAADLSRLLERAGLYFLPQNHQEEPQPYPWIRLVLPLNLSGRLIGLWLFGRRDPDDLYSRSDILALQTLAHQTAIALGHIFLAEDLQELYQFDIDRREAERTHLARELHDAVLNQITALAMYIDNTAVPPQFHQAYQALTARLRQTIADLRPAMLAYGLPGALEELVDGLNDQTEKKVSLELESFNKDIRYPTKVEEHLFRIVQQATENALRHAQAQTICIRGRLEGGHLALFVEDDGIGFAAGPRVDLTTLLAHKHFGLAGMFERAQLIEATLHIDSNPGRGTRIQITWGNKNV